MNTFAGLTLDPGLADRAGRIYQDDVRHVHRRTDRLFAALMGVQWIAGILLAFVVSPRAWVGGASHPHLHIWLAIFGGALVMGPPAALALFAPGRTLTRHAIAIGQMLESALLIHITGGRIETHFHVFGSLAFLAFYRDWRVLATGSAVVALDHILRGQFWPESVYGIAFGVDLRWLEHSGWVAFMDAFLVWASFLGLREMRGAALRQAAIEAQHEVVEREVERRTRELRESEEKFRQMAEHIDEVFWVTSADMTQMLYISPGYEKIWGRSCAGLIAHPESWADSIHPEDRERVWKAASAHAATGKYSATYRILRPDGSIRWLFDHGNPIRNEAGETIRLTGSVVDITHLKEVEENLVRSNVELERFAYVASHDLQEPLRSVTSFLQILQKRYKGRLDSDADEFIQFAVDGARRMKGLIGDLLTYSRLNSQAKPVETVALNDALDVALENLQASILETGARLSRDPLPEIPADGAQIAQVFQNLVGNAIKFHGDRPPEIHIGAERTDSGWTVRVRDNGIGIDPQYADRIFEIFQRLNGQKYAGSGIGLTICKKIVERHGGRIWMESAAGHGATFFFTLPDAAAASKPGHPRTSPRRVLVVDDDPMTRKLVRKTLEAAGMAVEEAGTGPEGVEMAHRLHPAAVVLDIDLPGRNGNQVRRDLQGDPETRGIPVMMITSEADFLDPEFARSNDWMQKPLSTSELRSRLKTLVE